MTMVKTLEISARVALAATFLYAAASKILHSEPVQEPATIFAQWSYHHPQARYGLIAAELALAAWLFSGVKSSVAGLLALALISAFTGLLILELQKKNPRPCGCTGSRMIAPDSNGIRTSLQIDAIRNVILIACAGWLYLSVRIHKSATIVWESESLAKNDPRKRINVGRSKPPRPCEL